jgi:hypothetical protein
MPFQTRRFTEAPYKRPTSFPPMEGLRPGGQVPEPGTRHNKPIPSFIHVHPWFKTCLSTLASVPPSRVAHALPPLQARLSHLVTPGI